MKMLTALLLTVPLSSLVACGAEPASLQTRLRVNAAPQAGEAGTLLELGADQRPGIYEMALSANYLYFAVPWAGVYRMPKYGGEVEALEEDANALFRHITTDKSDGVFWDHIAFTASGSPYTRLKGKASERAATEILAEGDFQIDESGVTSLRAVGGFLYWMSSPAGSASAKTERVPTTGGPREVLQTFDDVKTSSRWLVDAEGIYFTTFPLSQAPPLDCTLEMLASPWQGTSALSRCPTNDSSVFGTDAASVYLRSSTAVWRAPKGDRNALVEAVAVAPESSSFYDVVLDDASGYVKVSDQGSWRWVRFPLNGGAMTTIADSTLCPNLGSSLAVANDVAYLYLACGAGDHVVIVPKTWSK